MFSLGAHLPQLRVVHRRQVEPPGIILIILIITQLHRALVHLLRLVDLLPVHSSCFLCLLLPILLLQSSILLSEFFHVDLSAGFQLLLRVFHPVFVELFLVFL